MPKLLVVLAGIPLLMLAALLSADYAIVDVHEKGPQGHHIVVPLPLALARVALALAPREAQRVELAPEAAEQVAFALPILEKLRALPDFELVNVEDHDQQVSIRKVKDALAIDVHGSRSEDVHVSLPLSAARRALEGFDGHAFDTTALVAALGSAGGELVHVSDANAEVDRKSTRLNSSHSRASRMPSSA